MKRILLAITVLLLFAFSAFAETTVTRIGIAKSVEKREPVAPSVEFSKNVGKLYCFTEVTTDEYPTEITHIWIYQKNIIAEVPLAVDSPRWRTHSSKIILPEWTGEWKVEVYSKAGQLLDSINFTINE